jgi:hypothetical protein
VPVPLFQQAPSKRELLRDSKSSPAGSSISAAEKTHFATFLATHNRLFRLQKICARQAGRRRTDMRPEARHGEAAAARLNPNAAVLSRVKDLGAAEAKRVLHTLGRGQIGQAAAATDHDKLRSAPIGEAAGVVLSR